MINKSKIVAPRLNFEIDRNKTMRSLPQCPRQSEIERDSHRSQLNAHLIRDNHFRFIQMINMRFDAILPNFLFKWIDESL